MSAIDERRRFERTSTSIRVEITHAAFGTIIGFAHDISDGGASVKIDNQPLPPVGTVVDVKFRKMIGAINVEPTRMRVMRQQRNVVGLMFIS